MRYLKLIFLLFGIALLWWVLQQADLAEIWQQISAISGSGIFAVFVIYSLYFGADVVSWQVTMNSVDMTLKWAMRLFIVRMIGEAYNNITPMASMGGEPIKAWLLKSNYDIPLRDSGASLILAKTASMFSLVVFAGVGVIVVLQHGQFTQTHRLMVILGFSWIVFNVVVFFLMQHLKLSTFAASSLGRTRLGKRLGRLISGMHGLDEQFAQFYSQRRATLALSMFYAMGNWILGVAELYVILTLIGHPVTWFEAWLIEAVVQMIRTAAFFIPAGVGAQEGALMLTCGIITGSPNVGISAALVRRFRELVWIAASLLLTSLYPVDVRLAEQASSSSRD